jgi:two-component system chemotaxis response regulator CheB
MTLTAPRRTRVLIAEDSEAMRTTLQTLIDRDPRLQVIGTAVDGREAVAMAKSLRPDVITMDIVMPHLDGVEATAHIMSDNPVRILIISSYVESRQVDLAFRAMAAGALEVVAKPANSHPAELHAWARRLCDAIVLMAEVPVIRRHRRRPVGSGRMVDAVGIVASTGGPLALSQILALLPGDLAIPLLIAQHIAEGFTEGLVRWLQRAGGLRVEVATDGAAPRPGHVYFAPEQRDLELRDDGVLHTPKARDRYTPSGDRLLASLARALGPRACGIVLTGMGDDGAAGLLAVRDGGGATFAQSLSTCVVWGMPQAALARNATTELRSLEGIAEEIVQLSGRKEAR